MLKKFSGWVATARFAKTIGFIHLIHGLEFQTLQIIIEGELLEKFRGKIGVGTAIEVYGTLVESPGAKQKQELKAENLTIIGACDASKFPIQKKDVSLEFLRTVPHLRLKTKTFRSIFKVRSVVSQAIHRFFEQDFIYVHTPIITSSDCEGAGEMFEVKAGDKPFFGQHAGLTVSGQLEAEAFAQAFTKVYTFGPTFRAEPSDTPRHAAEFWMIEPEVAFSTLDDLMVLAESFLKYLIKYTFLNAREEITFLREEQGYKIQDLLDILQKPFVRITHSEAQDLLVASGQKFEYPVGKGESLQSEHEKHLCQHFDSPVIVTDYPRAQKSFYMKTSDDRETVRCMDLLVPRVGEIIGGSQREDDLDKLIFEMRERGMELEQLDWYLDLRRFGSVPHSGFGMGLERFLMWITGYSNIRDVIPYPRVAGKIY